MVEPSFDELLEGAFPYTPRQLPVNRPAKEYCYIARTDEHFKEIERLKIAVVLYAPDIEVDLSMDQIAEYAAMTGLTTVQDVSIGILTRSRYLIHLPPDIEPIRIIKAIPDSVWDKGYSFWQWSPAMDSTICNPKYKVLLDIDGISVHLSKESEIASAIGTFGIYLGTLEQSSIGDVACATVAVAVTELENIPFQVEFVIGGWKTPVEVRAKTWLPIPLYKNEEIPKMSEMFKKTARAISSGEDSNTTEEGDTVSMTRRAIIDLCKGKDFDSLPPEVQEVVISEKTKEALPHNTETTRIEGTNDPAMVIVEANMQGGEVDPRQAETTIATQNEGINRSQQIGRSPQKETESSDIPIRIAEGSTLPNKTGQGPSLN